MKLSLICDDLVQLIVHPLDVSENLLNHPSRILSLVLLEYNLTLHLFLIVHLINLIDNVFTLCILGVHLIGKLAFSCYLVHMVLQLSLNIDILLILVLVLIEGGVKGFQRSFRFDWGQVWGRSSIWCDKWGGIVKQKMLRLLWYGIIKRDLRLLLLNPLCC